MTNGAPPPTGGGGRGTNIVMLLALLLLIAGLVFWAYQRNPPDTPSPNATAMPEALPGGSTS
jgi:hypothetical protein